MATSTPTRKRKADQTESSDTSNETTLDILNLIEKKVPYSKIVFQFKVSKGSITRIKQERAAILDAWEANKMSVSKIMKLKKF